MNPRGDMAFYREQAFSHPNLDLRLVAFGMYASLALQEDEMATVGEGRVRTTFNPSADGVVDQIKQKSAELIDLCETLKAKDPRLAALAQTGYEEAAMWAVKAATAG